MQKVPHLDEMDHDVIPAMLCELDNERFVARGCDAQSKGCSRSHSIAVVVFQQICDHLYPA